MDSFKERLFFFSFSFFLLSSTICGSYFFNYDPIENNQYILNNNNPNILSTTTYYSIIFDQSHEMPYGTFLFKDIENLEKIDAIGSLSQFIFKKGDYRYRDLLISLKTLKNNNVKIKYIASIKSFTPLYIPFNSGSNVVHKTKNGTISGDSYLQNHIISIERKTNFKDFHSSILYHDENPYVPISYRYHSADSTTFNTRGSKSVSWGFYNKQYLNKRVSYKFGSQNIYSNIIKYNTHIENSNTDSYSKNKYFTGNNYIQFLYNTKSFSFLSSFSTSRYNMVREELPVAKIDKSNIYKETFLFKAWLESNIDKIYFDIFLDKITFNFNNSKKEYLNIKPTLDIKINKFQFKYTNQDGFVDLDTLRSLMNFNKLQFVFSQKHNNKSRALGLGYISNVSTQNHLEKKIYDGNYTYFDIDLSYLSNYIDFYFNSRQILSVQELDRLAPWIKDNATYQLKIKYPMLERGYTLFLNLIGNYLLYKDVGLYVNELPIIRYIGTNNTVVQHFINCEVGLEFKNFILSYNNITNNGSDFSVDWTYSDIGDSFALPMYSFFSSDFSVFHYLKISWSFLD